MQRPIGLNWDGVQLRQGIQNLSRAQRVAIVLDRRIDAERKVDFKIQNTPLETLLRTLATQLNLEISRIGPVVYIGPASTAERLRTVSELWKQEATKLPADVRSRLFQTTLSQWGDLAEPRRILKDLLSNAEISLPEIDKQIPHDLWPAARWPAMPLCDRLLLIVSQFDRHLAITENGSLALVPFPTNAVLERKYPLAAFKSDLATIQAQVSRATFETKGNQLIVTGLAEDHDLIQSFLTGKKSTPQATSGGTSVYSLNTSASVQRLLDQLGKLLNLTIELDEDAIRNAGISLDQEVKVSVKKVTVSELFKAVLSPAKLTFEIKDSTVIVRPMSASKP
ncbi:MAG: hypothetical protein SGJ20_15800 [Planctomycetota bacterium]|nr:hypothetical protein [Planctomycetota bacterium]